MARGIIDLIQENKRRFYAGEIRNSFYEESDYLGRREQSTVIINNASTKNNKASLWQNLKIFGQKFSEDLFYEPAK